MEEYCARFDIRTDSGRLFGELRACAGCGCYVRSDSFCLLEFTQQIQQNAGETGETVRQIILSMIEKAQPGELLVLGACVQKPTDERALFFFYDGKQLVAEEGAALGAEDDRSCPDTEPETLWDRMMTDQYDCCTVPVKRLLGINPGSLQKKTL